MFSHLEPLLITSDALVNEDVFTGYAFSGAHLIIGEIGYQQWLSTGRQELEEHLDGCYMVVSPRDGQVKIGADYKGYCKLYVYQRDGHWAVSNSFSKLVESVRARGWVITPNRAVISTWSFPGAFWQQFSTFETAAHEISVLPRQHSLEVDDQGTLNVVKSERTPPTPDRQGYLQALGEFVQTWIGRIGTTIRRPDTQLLMELTGGVDSRVPLALALALRQFFPTNFGKQLMLSSGLTYPDDLRVATQIAKTYRIPINRRQQQLTYGTNFRDPFEQWRAFSLGSYGPIYWPAANVAEGRFTVGGHGGEGHRSYWTYESPQAVLEAHRDSFPDAEVYRSAANAFEETRMVLEDEYPGVSPTVAHYREFRDRLHSGLHAQQQIRLQPLASKLMYAASDLLSTDALNRGQMLYDVVGLAAPSLLSMPYDTPSKVPSHVILGDLAEPVAMNPMRGEIFGLGDLVNAETPLRSREALGSGRGSVRGCSRANPGRTGGRDYSR
ncbi:hypothetical protein [Agrococcus casei]|uniref:Asparagine synthetase domain-containing protein n=1 Tax=Agrococcus casei LMG 22410 TaxID=1255656 RepID=A0A1R4FBP0_9MICO|nr:hypothetical protein [Agrococcus casei]SJM53306.1 hypothetical protein CZ674_03735 [Agrococcus casei LMG 22410]